METLGVKAGFFSSIGVVGAFLSTLFGGWDSALTILVIFMAIDYVSGLVVAGIFKKSPKTESGSLASGAGWKGLFRKGMTLLMVLIAAQLDNVIGSTFIKNAVVIAYIANETISIVENAGLMGVPIPDVIKKAIDILNKKSEGDTNETN
ncbi:phage holin family protein [Anaerovorax sp. IOR16]|uniref:phage holin family protein n=1 Tax=Anaerovorax sp. IOR16 TaxID=2773458 RepID=UPI0019D2A76A|nr:phage holin family protein [Anaerovorax sp. IOR16]